MTRHNSKSFRRPWTRVGLAVIGCLAFALVVHLAWVRGYEANTSHPPRPLGKIDQEVAAFTANISRWKEWLVPVFSLIFASAFKDALSQLIEDHILARLKGLFRRTKKHPHKHHAT